VRLIAAGSGGGVAGSERDGRSGGAAEQGRCR
jgi:hypothetical protein